MLSSGFLVSAKSVFVFLQSTIPRSSGLVKHKCSQCHRSYARLYMACEFMKPQTEGATLTGAMSAAKDVNVRHTCVVTWRSILESHSSNVTFAAASIVISVIT